MNITPAHNNNISHSKSLLSSYIVRTCNDSISVLPRNTISNVYTPIQTASSLGPNTLSLILMLILLLCLLLGIIIYLLISRPSSTQWTQTQYQDILIEYGNHKIRNTHRDIHTEYDQAIQNITEYETIRRKQIELLISTTDRVCHYAENIKDESELASKLHAESQALAKQSIHDKANLNAITNISIRHLSHMKNDLHIVTESLHIGLNEHVKDVISEAEHMHVQAEEKLLEIERYIINRRLYKAKQRSKLMLSTETTTQAIEANKNSLAALLDILAMQSYELEHINDTDSEEETAGPDLD